MTTKEDFKNKVNEVSQSVDTSPTQNAIESAVTNVSNSVQTEIGKAVNEVKGGVQSITSTVTGAKDKLNNLSTEGLINDATKSLNNFKNDAINSATSILSSALGVKVEVTFSDPDSNGFVFVEDTSLNPSPGVGSTVASVLQALTGLGVGSGSLQALATEASPSGLVDTVKGAVGKISNFDGVGALQSASSSIVSSVTNELNTISSEFTADINKTVSKIPDDITVDINDSGSLISGLASTATNFITAADEYTASDTNLTTNATADLGTTLTGTEISLNETGLKADLSELSGGKDGTTVLKSVNEATTSENQTEVYGNEYQGLINSKSGNSRRGVTQGISILRNPDVKQSIKQLNRKLSSDQIDQVIDLSQGDAADFSEAVRIVSAGTTVNYETIRFTLEGINTTIVSNNVTDNTYNVFGAAYVIGENSRTWNNGLNNPPFAYVTSTEELNAEFEHVTRNVDSMIVHWTETATDKNIGSEDINKYHLSLGIEGIGYHYVIRRDGSLQRGRPVNIVGDHTPSYNTSSIGVVFVGGINAPSGTPNPETFLSPQSLTRSQFNTFDHLCQAFFKKYPGGKVYGHSDLDDAEFDPGFEVIDYVVARFGKEEYTSENASTDSFLELLGL
jgi:hypothetical protein